MVKKVMHMGGDDEADQGPYQAIFSILTAMAADTEGKPLPLVYSHALREQRARRDNSVGLAAFFLKFFDDAMRSAKGVLLHGEGNNGRGKVVQINAKLLGFALKANDPKGETGLEKLTVSESKFDAAVLAQEGGKARHVVHKLTRRAQQKQEKIRENILRSPLRRENSGIVNILNNPDPLVATLLQMEKLSASEEHGVCNRLFETSRECHVKTTDEKKNKMDAKGAADEMKTKKTDYDEKEKKKEVKEKERVTKEVNTKEADTKAREKRNKNREAGDKQAVKQQEQSGKEARYKRNSNEQRQKRISNEQTSKQEATNKQAAKSCLKKIDCHNRPDRAHGAYSASVLGAATEAEVNDFCSSSGGSHTNACADKLKVGSHDICSMRYNKEYKRGGIHNRDRDGFGCFIGKCDQHVGHCP